MTLEQINRILREFLFQLTREKKLPSTIIAKPLRADRIMGSGVDVGLYVLQQGQLKLLQISLTVERSQSTLRFTQQIIIAIDALGAKDLLADEFVRITLYNLKDGELKHYLAPNCRLNAQIVDPSKW